MDLTVIPITKPGAANFIFGQSHFIKAVKEALGSTVGAVVCIGIRLAFWEASYKEQLQ
jgi:adenosine/AMP kinase